MAKIAFFDIDGTLINVPNNMMKPTQKTKDALQEFQKQGNYIVVASARGAMPESVSEIPFDGFIGCDGGKIIFQNEVLLDRIFTADELKLQDQVYKKHQGQYIVSETTNQFFSDETGDLIKKHQLLYKGSDEIEHQEWTFEDVKANTVTALFHTTQEIHDALDELPKDWAINVYDTGHIRMDVHPKGFSKGTACQYLWQYLNIDQKETYAFGDGDNDVEMLELVGCGVAMGNASDEVKQHGNMVTLSVDDDGIANAFSKLFQIEVDS